MEIIKGYKIFDKDFKAKNGQIFTQNKTYRYNGKIIPRKQGFHFAKRLEDTLRYSKAFDEDVIITQVTALGNVMDFSDEYYGYYDLYVTDIIRIDRVLSREEIIEYSIELNDDRLCRFISGIKLSWNEIRKYLDRSDRVLKTIEYYQLGNKEAFIGDSFLPEWKGVKVYGKYYNKRC